VASLVGLLAPVLALELLGVVFLHTENVTYNSPPTQQTFTHRANIAYRTRVSDSAANVRPIVNLSARQVRIDSNLRHNSYGIFLVQGLRCACPQFPIQCRTAPDLVMQDPVVP
jgi:hypothetical protein